MNFVVLPSKTLCDPYPSPFLLCENSKASGLRSVKQVLREKLEHRFGEDDVSEISPGSKSISKEPEFGYQNNQRACIRSGRPNTVGNSGCLKKSQYDA